MAIQSLYTMKVYGFIPVLADDGQGGEDVTYPSVPSFQTWGRVSQAGQGSSPSADRVDEKIQAMLYSDENTFLYRGVRIRIGEATVWGDGSSWVDGSFWQDMWWEVESARTYQDLSPATMYQRSALYRIEAGT